MIFSDWYFSFSSDQSFPKDIVPLILIVYYWTKDIKKLLQVQRTAHR